VIIFSVFLQEFIVRCWTLHIMHLLMR
jgi:hypothetical protein